MILITEGRWKMWTRIDTRIDRLEGFVLCNLYCYSVVIRLSVLLFSPTAPVLEPRARLLISSP